MQVVKKFLTALLLIIAVLIGFWVVMDNSQVVTFRLLGFTISSLPLGVWALALLLSGCVLGMLVSILPFFNRRPGK